MEQNQQSLIEQLQNIRTLLIELKPTDAKTINDFAWTVVKLLHAQLEALGSANCRRLLADYMQLPTERPSQVHSAILSSAVRVASAYPDFRFATFLHMWGVQNFLPEDRQRQRAADGKTFPSLVERATKALAHSLLLHQDEDFKGEESLSLISLLQGMGYIFRPSSPDTALSVEDSSLSAVLIHPMLVTRIKEATGKDGRKYRFITLTSPEGLEVETIAHSLQPSPLLPLPEGQRHYVNIGQLYNCLLKTKQDSSSSLSLSLKEAFLSPQKSQDIFPLEIGYIEAIDTNHGHMHIYDAHSRHFVAPVQRFSRERVGDFVRFIPIVPAASKFKTAIIQGSVPVSVLSSTVPSDSPEGQPLLREIRITAINKGKGYVAWELTDKDYPITERLSPLQLSQGETSPSFTSGYLDLTEEFSASLASGKLAESSTLKVFVYLKRGRDGKKRPHIAKLC